MYSLVEVAKIIKYIQEFAVDEKEQAINDLLDGGDLIFHRVIESWFEDFLKSIKQVDVAKFKELESFYIDLYNIIKPYNDIYQNNHRVINSNIAELEKTRVLVEKNIVNNIKRYDHNELSDTFDSIIEKSSFGYTGTISSMRQRLLDSVNKETCKYFWQNEKENVKIWLEKLKNYLDNFLSECKAAQKQKTQEILQSRKQFTLQAFNWDNEKDYLDHANLWENIYIIDNFLGIAGQYISWKYPVAYIEPNSAELTRHIISGDPFYVIDDWQKPYDNIIESLPEASRRKVYHYNRKTALSHLEESSVGVCVSWNNFPFKTQGNIFKDIELMSHILRPGGYAIFNYADAHSVSGAEFIEKNVVSVCWKEKIDQFASDNNLIEISTHNYNYYAFAIAVYQKVGKNVDLNITNKLGLVLPNEKHLEQKRLEQTEDKLKAQAARSKLEQDLKRLQERDQLLRDLDEKRQLGQENILELKLQKAINHLNSMIAAYDDYTHPSVLESLLHVSKITYSLGRVKDSKNLIKRVERDVAKMSADNFIARKYREWQDFLNNIDT